MIRYCVILSHARCKKAVISAKGCLREAGPVKQVLKEMKALSWSSTESIYANLMLHALSHLVRGPSAVKRSPLQKSRGLGDKRNSFFKSIVTAFASEGPKCEIIWQGMSHSVKQDAGSHTACVLPWDRLGTSICSFEESWGAFSFCSTFSPLAVLPELGHSSFSFSDVM